MPTRREFLERVLVAAVAPACLSAGQEPAAESISLTGDPRTVGRKFGQLNGAHIRMHAGRVLRSWKDKNLSEQTIHDRCKPFRRFAAKFAPAWMEEIEATATAADLPAEQYLAYLAGKYRGLFLLDECTSFLAVGAAAADGVSLFHKNRDNTAREQAAYYKRVLHASRPAGFFATGDTSDVGLMMMVNEHGLAGSADTGGLREDRPKGRGVANPYILRLIAERAECCRHALEIIQQMIRDGWYAGGNRTGTHWLFADRTGTGLRVAQNSHEEKHWFLQDQVAFLARDKTPAARALAEQKGRITVRQMNAAAAAPDICFTSSISAMTVRIDPQRPAELSTVWFSLPAWNVYLPLPAVGAAAPRQLVDGSLFHAAYRLLPLAAITAKRGVQFRGEFAQRRSRLQESFYAESDWLERSIRAACARGAKDEAARLAAEGAARCTARLMQLLESAA